MFIFKKFMGETKFPSIVVREEEKIVETVEAPKVEKKAASKKKVAEKPVEITNEEKSEE